MLADLDVTLGQGFFLARPGPPWATVTPAAARACREAFRAALGPSGPEPVPGEPRVIIERLAGRLASCDCHQDIVDALADVSSALGARRIVWSRLVGDGLGQRLLTWATDDEHEIGSSFSVAAFPETARVLRTGEAAQVTVGDPSSDPAETALLRELGFTTMLMLPLLARGKPIGLLEAFSDDDRPFSRQRIGIARTIAHQLAIMLQADSDRWRSVTDGTPQTDTRAEARTEPRGERDDRAASS